MGVADLVKTPAGGLEIRIGVVPVDSARSGGDARFRAALETYRRRNDSLVARPLAEMKRPLVREGEQYPLGALLAEGRRNALRADLGLIRGESIRADLPAGPVTFERLSAVEPARSDLVRLTLTGAQLTAVLERALAGTGPTIYLAGAQVRYDPRAAAGKRVRGVVLQGGRKLRAAAEYTLATDEASAQGAGGLTPLAGLTAERAGLIDVEAAAAFLRRLPQPVEAARASASSPPDHERRHPGVHQRDRGRRRGRQHGPRRPPYARRGDGGERGRRRGPGDRRAGDRGAARRAARSRLDSARDRARPSWPTGRRC